MDASALSHDKDYDHAEAHFFIGAVLQKNSIAANIALIQRANKVKECMKQRN